VLHYETFKRQQEQVTLSFASKSELAVGLLLEKYIPDFEMIPGKTFQVPIAFGKQCDFRIGHIYLEYHPVNLQFDFKDKQALHELRKGLRHVKKPFKEQIVEALKQELAERYYRERKHAVEAWGTKDAELVVVQDAVELYRRVIKPYGRQIPKEHLFVGEFNKLKK
jgi:hypothetical protein